MTSSTKSIIDLVQVKLKSEDEVLCLYVDMKHASVREAAEIMALNIAERRLGMYAVFHRAWSDLHDGGNSSNITVAQSTMFDVLLLVDIGTRIKPKPDEQFRGFVAEQLFTELVHKVDFGIGLPEHYEGHDYSAIDPGGDGLAFHRVNGSLCFRLWESKYHSDTSSSKSIVNKASKQIRERGASYLARWSIAAQRMSIPTDIAVFYAKLVELWVNKDPSAGAGITVSTSLHAGTNNPFSDMASEIDLESGNHHGQLNTIDTFELFADEVREHLWKGCGL
ncbi:MAG: hypothetical protein HQ477_00425 [Chloroflexi bacterium]|nr:hypothetical protein [Chloroflexota bacterium]